MLDGESLLQHCHAQPTIDEIRRQSRLAPEVFNRDLRAALVAYAEFVQLAPASESHHHAHPGGLLAHTLEVVLLAMTLRNGFLLPLHAPTEHIDRQRDHWTFAVFLAALLHDIGKIMTDLRLQVRDTPKSPVRRWLPLSGALTQSRAHEYRVGFAPTSERDYLAHRKLAVVLLHGIVPANALAFIGRESIVLESLTCFLGSDDKPGAASADGAKALAQIIKTADQRSVAHNLQHGPRNRFNTATALPLIERLMTTLRSLLAQGTALPLNRDGAAGWVYDGAVWFVAKRLADTVRAAIQKEDPDEGMPGPTKNDRLFDAFQDYGVIDLNPISKQAIWYVTVVGEGYSHRLSMLKFPLPRLFDDPGRYPAPMLGRIEPRKQEEPVDDDGFSTPKTTGAAASDAPVPEPMPESTASKPAKRSREPASLMSDGELIEETAPSNAPLSDAAAMVPPSPATGGPNSPRSAKSGRGDIPAPKPPPMVKKPVPAKSAENPSAAETPQATRTERPSLTLVPSSPEPPEPDDEYLDAQDAMGASRGRTNKGARNPPKTSAPTPVSAYAVAPKLAGGKEPSRLAISFMEWVQRGLAQGSLLYNEAGAPIHFLEQGMALVSPRIFREYALETNAQADAVQQQVIRAGWHVKASQNNNILHFAVLKRDGVRAGKLSAVVIHRPEQWINPLPPINKCIVPFELFVDPTTVLG